jgi:hypothetical protein
MEALAVLLFIVFYIIVPTVIIGIATFRILELGDKDEK